MVQLQDILLEHLLEFFSVGRLVEEFTVTIDLENVRLHSPHDLIVVRADSKLNFNNTVRAVDRVNQLRLVDVTVSLSEQTERDSVQHRGLTSTVVAHNQDRLVLVQVYF